MDDRFTKKYLRWFYDIRVAKIKYNGDPSEENRIVLEKLQQVKWYKTTKYKKSYIKSGGLDLAIEKLNLFNSQLEDFYSKLV
jgi:hypothetical protein